MSHFSTSRIAPWLWAGAPSPIFSPFTGRRPPHVSPDSARFLTRSRPIPHATPPESSTHSARSLTFRSASCCNSTTKRPSNLNPNKEESRSMKQTPKLLTGWGSLGHKSLADARRRYQLTIGNDCKPCIKGMAADRGHESRSPHPSHRADALASPLLVQGIGPRADWPRFKSETSCESTLQGRTSSLPVPPENLLGEPASGLSADKRPALVSAEPSPVSATIIPDRVRATPLLPSLHVTHQHQLPKVSRSADRFSGKQLLHVKLLSEGALDSPKTMGAAFGAGAGFCPSIPRTWPTR